MAANTKSQVEKANKERKRKYEEETLNTIVEKLPWMKYRPLRWLSDEEETKLKVVLERQAWCNIKLLCPENPEMYLAGSGILNVALVGLGIKGDTAEGKLQITGIWDTLVEYIKNWYRDKVNGVLRKYTDEVLKRKLCVVQNLLWYCLFVKTKSNCCLYLL